MPPVSEGYHWAMIAYLPVAASGGFAGIELALGIVFGIVCYRMFERAGKPAWVGFILGFLLGLIGLLIAWLITRNANKSRPAGAAGTPGQANFCPHCGAALPSGASFCASCGQQIA